MVDPIRRWLGAAKPDDGSTGHGRSSPRRRPTTSAATPTRHHPRNHPASAVVHLQTIALDLTHGDPPPQERTHAAQTENRPLRGAGDAAPSAVMNFDERKFVTSLWSAKATMGLKAEVGARE